MQVSAIGMGWYEREDYPRIRTIMADADRLPATYDDFLKLAERGERDFKAKGGVVIRAVIKPDEFLAWCNSRNLKVDSQARGLFASEVAAAEVRRRQGAG